MVSPDLIWSPILQHIILAYTALLASIVIGISLAVLSLFSRTMERVVLVLANLVQAVPTFAVVAIVVPLIGIGFWPAIIAIFLRALLPIVKNTLVGLTSTDPALIAAAEGIGLSKWEIIRYVRFKNAYPAIFAGVKFAAILANSVAILTAMIGSGGLGTLVFEGLAGVNMMKMLSGALPAIAIALFLDGSLSRLERRMVPPGVREA
ncbi:MAG: ABC transporter permease [Methanocalculus sp. MSAO_Arc1]|uniref:ABC transporter permease n=1 Tax=Methanocalculus TaxID=71151 RepID=UPI000FF2AD92|nr:MULTISPECIES: ABC transporter permease [unclassified Methanocalculus]MCP1661707.1 osmoprotectant transport system permease protein [Methanocalculus sp. AMF5]RQD80498.1 MAG: ABC transporter permease [Methanocalculus sp. MSAO_Arc1]